MDASPNKQATLQVVAEHAGVSKSTASMILSGQSKYVALFTPETVRKVHRSAAALGYRTNVFASRLGATRTPFFALIIAGSEHENEWAYDAFESLLVGGVLSVAADAGTHPIVLTMPKNAAPARMKSVDDIIFGGVFGTIARTPPAWIEGRLREQLRRRLPVVVVFPEDIARWSSNVIEADNHSMGALAGDIFAHHGRKRWVLIGFTSTSVSQETRREGLAQAAERYGAKLQVIRLAGNPRLGQELRELILPRLVHARPDAIFGVSTAASAGGLIAASNMGLVPGEDVSIIGVDYPHWTEEVMAEGSLTSLSVSWKAAGKLAMEKLLAMRSSDECRFPNTLLRPTVKVGRSCPVPADLASPNGFTILSA